MHKWAACAVNPGISTAITLVDLPSALGVQVMDLKTIRRRYLRGWAAIDFAAAVPWDLVMIACGDAWVGKLQVTAVLQAPAGADLSASSGRLTVVAGCTSSLALSNIV